ncbi:MAG TPA: thermonuclease family protein [Phycisphaerae bacterium]|nr:thermonuclease family protein [Phycisphaerae bacterium]
MPLTARRRWLLVITFAALAVLVVADRLVLVPSRQAHLPADDWQRYHGHIYTVSRVVDGDTVDLDVPDIQQQRQTTRVRLWGVDTPEKARGKREAMHFADEATAFVLARAEGKAVQLHLHPNKDTRGKYGRLLAYVVVPETGQVLNELLVATGHAYADRRFDHQYMDRYVQLEDTARREHRGLWAEGTPEQWPAWRRRMIESDQPQPAAAPAPGR